MPSIPEAVAGLNAQQDAQRQGDAGIVPRTDGAATLPVGMPAIVQAGNPLLPMAFPEGSPMHAAYGAGHATVAGACLTIPEAFSAMSKGRVRAIENGIKRPLDVTTIKRATRAGSRPRPWTRSRGSAPSTSPTTPPGAAR